MTKLPAATGTVPGYTLTLVATLGPVKLASLIPSNIESRKKNKLDHIL